MIALGVSFLLFWVVVGLTWIIGAQILAQLMDRLPAIAGPWGELQEDTQDQISMILTFLPGVLFLFAAIKMAINAGNRGSD